MNKAGLSDDHMRELESDRNNQLEKIQRQQQSLESQLARLREEKNELKQHNSQLKQRLSEDKSGASRLRLDKSAFYAGASTFMSSGIWDHIVKAVLESAHQNANRAYYVSQSDWEGLVIDDALPNILPESESPYVEDVEYWLGEAVKGIYASKLRDASGSSFEAFSETNPLSRTKGALPTGSPEVTKKASTRFRKAASEAEMPASDLPYETPYHRRF